MCDRSALRDPSVNTTCAVAASSIPELEDEAANPLGVLVLKEPPGSFRGSELGDAGEKTDGEGGEKQRR
ncbi:hypothetical protein NDU88_004265 [Pleurodeles waltl]|uniref:Uncharacterized protein n=1 Tax=Pleurodeles waltl TaxID=8319 RepID=A0AAV7MUD8_PLEWA|nr:hypothetical protein NDU88_004265 [Pleurodeles waltl]